MQLLKIFGKRSKDESSKASSKLFTDIAVLPIGLWDKVRETGNETYLYVDEELRGTERTEQAAAAWVDIERQIVDRFGLSSSFKRRLKMERKMWRYKIDAVLKNRPDLLNFARVEELAIQKMDEANTNSITFMQMVTRLEARLKMQINTFEYPVEKYLQHIHNLNAERNG